MLTLISYHVRAMLRNRSILIWSLAFPIILATLFSVMLSGVTSNMSKTSGVALGVVADARYEQAGPLRAMLDGLSTGDDALFSVTEYGDEPAADAALFEGDVVAYVTADADGAMQLRVASSSSEGTQQGIVRAALDQYAQGIAAGNVLHDSEAAMQDQPSAGTIRPDAVSTTALDILRVEPSELSRYYYAMLAYSCIVGGNVALLLVGRVRTRDTEAGLRCQLAAATPAKQLGAAFCAAWFVNFCLLLIAFAYIRFVLGVSFGGREWLAPVACAVCACVSCAVGALVGSLPRFKLDTKDTIISVVTLVLCLPAGLFGEPAIELSNWLFLNAPWVQAVNPAVQVSQAFLTLAYHDSLTPFASTLGALLAIAAVCFGIAALFMRRQRYAHL